MMDDRKIWSAKICGVEEGVVLCRKRTCKTKFRRIFRFLGEDSKNLFQTIFFGVTIVHLLCGQEPPGLQTLGEVAPENVYSDGHLVT